MPRTSLVALALALGALSVLPSIALEAHLVADINPQFFSEGSNPGPFVSLGGRVVFQVRDRGLWTSNGTEEETQRLGPQDLNVISDPVGAGSLAYFLACRGNCSVWRTDGTEAGTLPLVQPESLGSTRIEVIAPAGSPWTYFVVDKGFLSSVWRTNGTPQGTRLLFDQASRARELTYFQGRLYFLADVNGTPGLLYSSGNQPGSAVRVGTSVGGRGLVPLGGRLLYFSQVGEGELWATNGTSAGTRRLTTLRELPVPIVVTANRAFFFDLELEGGVRFWVSDGTATGSKVLRTFDGVSEILAVGSRVAFSVTESNTGGELWTSDGSALGTRLVKDICPGPCTGVGRFGLSSRGRLWFQGTTPTRGTEVWTSDLTASGTRLVKDLCRGGCSSRPEGWIESGNRVFFSASRSDGRARVARSDGTPTGTFWLAEGGQFASLSGVPFGVSGSIFFAGSDDTHGVEPWRSDGTVLGTQLVADLRADNQVGSRPRIFASAGGLGFFFAGEDVHGFELWASDGTAAGTRLAYDQRPGSPSSDLPELPLSSAGGRLLYFSESGIFQGFQLVASDGSPAGSGPLLPPEVIADGRHLRVGDRFYFVAHDAVHGSELWVTDGTAAGTIRLTDLVPPEPFRPASASAIFLGLGDRLVAPVLSPAGGEELWISDGSIGGTRPLEEVYPFLELSLARAGADFLSRGGFLYYVSIAAGADSASLWRTDLTANGTGPVGGLDLSDSGARSWSLFEVGGKIFILGFANGLGGALWTSDGTDGGTRLVAPLDWSPGVTPLVFAGRLWGSRGFGETWSSDGTVSGTSVFRDNTGSSVRARELGVVGNRLIFVGERSLTESDGTPEGTVAIELEGGRIPDFVDALFLGDKALFNGSDPLRGEELWILTPQ